MISKKWFRDDFEFLKERMQGRDIDISVLEKIRDLDKEMLVIKSELDIVRSEKNLLSKKFENSKVEKMKKMKIHLQELENKYETKKREFDHLISIVPAVPDLETPPLEDQEILVWGKIDRFKEYKSYLELSLKIELIDLKSSVRNAGSGFSTYTDKGEKIIRALIAFTLDWAERHGFKRYYLPVIVNRDSLFCTSQISKFQDTIFQIKNSEDKFLSPTAEVQLVNLYRGQIIEKKELPIKVCANTNCFRNEKMGAGTESKGIMRLYQFIKTELVMFVEEAESENALNYLSGIIEGILKELNLPFRKLLLSRKELSFSATKTYDFEVWMPSEKKYREISSLSNTRDFQSNRGKIRYKQEILDPKEKSKNVHILNGSCLAIDRLFAAILENYQLPNGDIQVPTCLINYLHMEKISK
ncbi:serine--tRNA ligase [Candidatus Mycoplasma haematominutum]|uniref:Serine--tRNA ligase n=1 Tax=Candidatus Mycoplasma haematominutum 'Birmingham 1' TaxID=1116213 RepID=G8C411_9MOLU|nr:serine--tRNA ligase [Candidatus Mycoplasma haematominutum]CCE67059.1 seryl-tRNA synthetase [Candidatus Mycoplasma haematominutum 'Birmingham 1']